MTEKLLDIPSENKAYAIFGVKALDEEKRIIRGIATTPAVDRVNDVVEAEGIKFARTIPLLWQHNHAEPIGTVKLKRLPDGAGLEFEATIPHVSEEGDFKKLVDKAWHSVKYQVVNAVSIGFRVLRNGNEPGATWDDDLDGVRFSKIEVYELSLVTVPANQEALITEIRNAGDRIAVSKSMKSVSGLSGVTERLVSALGAGNQDQTAKTARAVVKINPSEKSKETAMSYAKQIEDAKASLKQKSEEMADIMKAAEEAGTTLDADQTEEFDALASDVDQLKSHLKRLEVAQSLSLSTATPVEDVKDVKTGAAVRNIQVGVTRKPELAKGIGFARVAMATFMAKGNKGDALMLAERKWENQDERVMGAVKAAVGATEIGAHGSPVANAFVDYQYLASEFIDLLDPLTIVGRLNGMTPIPFKVRIPKGATGASANWIGEAKPIPLSKPTATDIYLENFKLASLCVMTEEMLRLGDPASEQYVLNRMLAAAALAVDEAYVTVANSGIANVKPASVTNGAPSTTASGTSLDDLETDLGAVMAKVYAAKLSGSWTWLMNPSRADKIGRMKNALGQKEHAGLTGEGGVFDGKPTLVSTVIPTSSMILIKPDEIFIARDNGVEVDYSKEASIIMSDAPATDGAATGSDPVVPPAVVATSMFQTDQTAIRTKMPIAWQRGRTDAVQVIASAAYGGA